ncbi:HAMP domain-containing protein, partial [Hyella patelloides]|uniref:HAMP domain-containing protein n=1 Tax=Hyella patelloides TaxID=1982969 RepID=UPI00119EE8FB
MVKTSPENSSPKHNLVNSRTLPQIENVENTLFTPKQKPAFFGASWWQKKSIRWKAMALAIALGTLPTATLGLVAYWAADNSISKEIATVRKRLAVDLRNEVNLFMRERFQDIQIMANLDILTDPKLRNQISSVEKAATLERIQETYDIYNSIGIFDLKGDVIAQTGDKPLGNHLNRGYIQAALKTNSAVLSQPRISTSSGIYSVYTAAPIKDKVTGKTIAVIRARIPVAVLEEILQDFTAEGDQYYLLDDTGAIFLSSTGNYAIKTQSNNQTATQEQTADYKAVNVEQVFSGISSQLDSDLPLTINSVKNQTNQIQQFIAFAPAKQLADLPSLNWQALIATDSSIVFAPQRRLGQIYTLGTLAIAIFVGAIAYYLANLATRPILAAAKTVEEIGEGNLKARITVGGKDEISQLTNNINLMAMQLEDFVQEQQLLAQQTDVVKQTVIALNTVLEKESLWDIAVTQARFGLAVDGVSYYSLEGDGQNQIVAESFIAEAVSQIGKDIYESAFLEEYITQNPESEIVAVDDIHGAELTGGNEGSIPVLTASQINKLETIFFRALAIAKVRQQGQLVGLLTAHRSSSDRLWQQSEIDFLAQIANQVSVTLDRLDFLQQQQDAQMREKQAKEDLQQRAFELLQQVDRISQGDLTIRAKVTEDEIGTIADSYNATIYSLQ